MSIKVPQFPTLLCTFLMFFSLCCRAAVPTAGHVVVVVEENQSYSDVIGNSSMPYLNALARQYGLATQYYANTHSSIGNYFMLTTGATTASSNGTVSGDNIVRHLLSAGKTWKAYAEGLPSPGYTGGDVYPYTRQHNPFTYFSDVVNSNVQRQNLLPMTQFSADLANGTLPNYSFVVPNVLHDGQNGALNQADQWLQANIKPLLKDPGFQQDGLLVIVFAQGKAADTAHGGGHVAAVLVGPAVKNGYKSTALYQHQNLLRTTLAALGVNSFPGKAANASDMGEMFSTPQVATASAAAVTLAAVTTGVTISSPANGARVSSPLSLKATFSGGMANYMKVWVDGVAKAPVLNTSSLTTSLGLSIGGHRLVVEAGYRTAVYKSTVNVTVSGSSPVLGKTIAGIQAMSGWRTCGACGNTGGTGVVAHYSLAQHIASPSLSRNAAKFSISGHAYSNGYWYHENSVANKTFSYLAYDFDIYIPKGYENSPQGIEFEVQQRINGRLYNYSWQALYSGNVWRTFDYGSKRWIASPIAYHRLSPGVWHHIRSEYHTEGSKSVHDALTIDGVRSAVRIVHNSVATSGQELENAFQLDLNSSGWPVQVYVDNMKVTWR
ncbi:MAG TPA: alkaline phosphatase family protein [Candidatus Angelobacter sp.]|nr:alkaline phosphatase family protein [Candidatus Angelobacter sp.]